MLAQAGKFFNNTLVPVLEKISDWPAISSIRSGLVLTLPLVMLGCLAIMVNNFPLEAYTNAMNSFFGTGWKDVNVAVYNGTTGIMALILLVSIGPHLATRHNAANMLTPVNPTITALVSLGSLLVLIRPEMDGAFLPVRWIGVSGLFIAILVALLSTAIFMRLSKVRALRLNFSSGSADYAIPQAFNSLLPAGITVLGFALFGVMVFHLTGVSVHEGFHDLLRMPFASAGDSLQRGLLYSFSLHLLWFFGVHGANVLDPITHSIYGELMDANISAYAAGLPLPHIMTKDFLDTYVFMGGSGASLCLSLALLLVGQAKNQRRLAGISLVPGIFNINEILLFGLPVVLNPIMLIPFIFGPLVLTVTSYMAVSLGVAPGPHAHVMWTTPIFLNAYLSTDSISGPMLQLFNLVLGICIYAPFIMLSDRMREKRTAAAFKELYRRSVNVSTVSTSAATIDSPDAAGALARNLVTDLEASCAARQSIFLEYQPQVTARGNEVCGVEALFRWRHPQFGMIPAPISVGLAEGSGLIHSLGRFALEEACATGRKWLDAGIRNMSIAVNVSALQLRPELVPVVRDLLRHYDLPHYMLELEVTESSALDPDSPESAVLQGLHKLGLRLAIDDFGMGHSSLKYLKEFPVDVIKIDGAITREVTFNPICADIVSSITKLCRARDIMSVAEFVETPEQIAELTRHGCDVYQGYYFSKPLPEAQCLQFIKSQLK